MMLQDFDQDSIHSGSPDLNGLAGPSSMGAGGSAGLAKNGITNGNGHSAVPATNGSSGFGNGVGNGIAKREHGSISKVSLPGTTLYDDSTVDREEFVRLVIQSLRDVGYIESASTLEAESGYTLEASEVSQFRRYILEGQWTKAEASLMHIGVVDEEGMLDAKFLISQQKYLELLEAQKTTAALHVLRTELAPLNVEAEHLHTLSSLIMCSEAEDLRHRAGWDGAAGTSRQQLLSNLHRYIPSSIMIPQRRIATLLRQALSYQRQRCVYHNSNSTNFSLYMDHQCDKDAFPRTTTTILQVHDDEVWNLEWSHDGQYLASGSKDKTAIIWKVGPVSSHHPREWSPHHILREHQYAVGCLAWSLDDSILLTSAEQTIKLWNTKTGVCFRTIDGHSDVVTALAWLPDDSGFISGSLDRKVIRWDREGRQRDSWGTTAIRVTDLAVTPDFTRLVTIGMDYVPPHSVTVIDANPRASMAGSHGGEAPLSTPQNVPKKPDNRMVIYDLATKQAESSIRLEGELTSVKISQNSQYALINHSPDEIHLWDLHTGRLTRKFTGQRQGRHVIRSCFGGVDGNFVVSGSEDGNVYVWHRDTGTLLEVLPGHGEGSVNSVAWNPRNQQMFASCSDDRTIRIWEANVHEELYPDTFIHPAADSSYSSVPTGKGKGKLRTQYEDDNAEAVSRTSGTGV
ncbi:hypothetical protein EYR40_000914 [Pleurotus pulmonarius]|nr:hypothetical protein EYR36_004645 [Pleurotus pulmonarius]KAF4603744.1 hypothetical protein EYR38_004159 [Pleurotus pulmonarius]KAF4608569.1 hypothetical protein EYR40_000914 [Pleurotus pulmonarius]